MTASVQQGLLGLGVEVREPAGAGSGAAGIGHVGKCGALRSQGDHPVDDRRLWRAALQGGEGRSMDRRQQVVPDRQSCCWPGQFTSASTLGSRVPRCQNPEALVVAGKGQLSAEDEVGVAVKGRWVRLGCGPEELHVLADALGTWDVAPGMVGDRRSVQSATVRKASSASELRTVRFIDMTPSRWSKRCGSARLKHRWPPASGIGKGGRPPSRRPTVIGQSMTSSWVWE
jgi:hypothetical protein